MPAITRSNARRHAAAANAAPIARRRPNRGITHTDFSNLIGTFEGNKTITDKLDRPNPLPRLQLEYESQRIRFLELQLMVKDQRKMMKETFKKMKDYGLDAFMKDEVINLVEEDLEPSPNPSSTSPPPLPRRGTPYPQFVQGSSRNNGEDLGYPDGCYLCFYSRERCDGCMARLWGDA